MPPGQIDLNVIEFNRIDAYVQQINTDLAQRPIAPSTVTRQIAYVNGGIKIDDKQQASTMIGGRFGREVIYPVPMFGNMDEARNPYEEVPHTPPELVNHKVIVREWAPKGEIMPRGTAIADIYGILQNQLPNIMALGQAVIETHTADLLGFGESATISTIYGIGGGNIVYDNLPFFSPGHLPNPNRPGVGVPFSNFFNGMNLDRAGLARMLDFLEATQMPDGQIVTLPGRNIIVVSTEDQLDRASVLLHGTQRVGGAVISVAGVPTGVGGSESNQLIGRADVVKLPALQRYNVVGGVAKGWYGFRVSGKHCGITVAVVEALNAYIEGLDPNSFGRVTRNVTRYGRRGHWGHGYLWPQMAGKAIES
jgi:hypothetical protein